jgi:hypothetical protein
MPEPFGDEPPQSGWSCLSPRASAEAAEFAPARARIFYCAPPPGTTPKHDNFDGVLGRRSSPSCELLAPALSRSCRFSEVSAKIFECFRGELPTPTPASRNSCPVEANQTRSTSPICGRNRAAGLHGCAHKYRSTSSRRVLGSCSIYPA